MRVIRCFLCKGLRCDHKGIMYTRTCADGKKHKICYDCIWDTALATLKKYQEERSNAAQKNQ